jgi:hypothetical protein
LARGWPIVALEEPLLLREVLASHGELEEKGPCFYMHLVARIPSGDHPHVRIVLVTVSPKYDIVRMHLIVKWGGGGVSIMYRP